MNLKFLVISLVLSGLAIAHAEEPINLSQYIGLTHPRLNDGLREQSGNMIGDPFNNTVYSVAWTSSEIRKCYGLRVLPLEI